MGVKLYYLPFSPPCRSVMFLAKELGVDLELKPVDLFQGEHLQPWYVELNPQHTIPTIDDNGFVLAESAAIVVYLYNQYGEEDGGSMYPKDPKERAIVDHRLYWDCSTFFPRLRAYVYPAVFGGASAFPKDAREKIEEALGWLDGFISKAGGWVAGPRMTLADFCLQATFSHVAAMKGIHEFDLSKYPNVVAWHAKCKAEMKGFEDTGAAGWWEFISSKAEGKNIE